MTAERLEQIKEVASEQAAIAQKILEGDRDNYDGADGARYIKRLCVMLNELIKEVESK